MNTVKRGALIVLEGVDRSGKSTQAKKLVESLNNLNIPAELMVFPDRTTHTGKLIAQYLSNKDCQLNDNAVHLLFTANRWENVDKMKKLISEGTTLIVDRYSYSGMAFSAVKKGMNLEWCKHPEAGLPKPDLVFLLTLAQNELENRPGFGDERYETSAFQKRVSNMYHQLSDESWKIINAIGSVEEVHTLLLKDTLEAINAAKDSELKTLDFSEKHVKNGHHITNGH